uniref:Conserved plasma membrane protein n=1 Tax=Steinernema glaseri TaxID=37863 RepID=A0A1I8ASB9_9BILA
MFALRCVAVALVAVIFHFSNAGVVRDQTHNVEMTYVSYDHSGGETLVITSTGKFYDYRAVKNAIQQIIDKQVDWCGFGLQLRRDGVPNAWTELDRIDFDKNMKDYACAEHKRRGLVSGKELKRGDQQSKESDNEKITAMTYALGGIIGIICLIAVVFIVVVIGVCIKWCIGSSPPPAVSYPEVKVDRSQRSQSEGSSPKSRPEASNSD